MLNTKHKIFLYPLEENGKIHVFLFQSGDIGADRGQLNFQTRWDEPHDYHKVHSSRYPEIQSNCCIAVNGTDKQSDFKIHSDVVNKQKLKEFKELERAYNNR